MFDAAMFAARRQRLAALIGHDAVLLVAAYPEALRNGDAHYKYRTHSDVQYLLGCEEPATVLVFRPGHATAPVTVFLRPRDPAREVWDGRRLGIEGARNLLGADQAYAIDELDSRLPELLSNRSALHYEVGVNEALDRRVMSCLAALRGSEKRGRRAPKVIADVRHSLHELRLFKQADEVELMRKAANITADAHVRAMQQCRPGMFEYEIEAIVDHAFRQGGATGPGYTSIVGGGANATILHYIENNARLVAGELLLVDAGAEVAGYTADITRTFPIGGSFSGPQRAIYELVLDVQQRLIADMAPGLPFDELQKRTSRGLAQGLIDLGIAHGSVDACIESGELKKYYMHGVSHWLGMDVHDVGAYTLDGQTRPLAAGMVLTVEPGIYIARDSGAPSEFCGIGVRIEDNILVTPVGYQVLTAACPKSVADIEALTRR